MAALDVEPVFAKRGVHPLGMFAVISRQQLFGPEIADVDGVAAGQRMPLVDDELKVFGEQRPGVEPVPVFADFGGNAEFGLALLQVFADLAGIAAQEAEFQPVELPLDLVEMRNQQREVDRMGQRDPERADFAALEGGRQRRVRRWQRRSIAAAADACAGRVRSVALRGVRAGTGRRRVRPRAA